MDQGRLGQGHALSGPRRRWAGTSRDSRGTWPRERAAPWLAACVGAAALLGSATASAGIPDAGLSTATAQAGTIHISPGGGGRTLAAAGCAVTVTVRDVNGQPIAGFSFQDLWLDSASPTELSFCPGGSAADADTDTAGRTTFSGSLRGGGFTQGGLRVLLAGVPISGSPVLPIQVNSPDITGDLNVNLGDVGPFSSNLNGTYNFRSDFFPDGQINLADVGIFSGHLGTGCP